MTAPVFVDPAAATAAAGDVLRVEGDEARHAVTVQRRQVGERVDVVDGAGARAGGLIAATGDVTVNVQEAGSNVSASFANVSGACFGEKTASSDLATYVGNMDLRKRKRYIRTRMAQAAGTAGVGGVTVVLLGAASLPCTPEATASFTV